MPFRGDDKDELDSREWPEPDPDGEQEEVVDTAPCPFCSADIYENAECCPHCRNYLFYDGSTLNQKPWWLLGGVAICLAIVFYWIFHS
jgi:hypothetical protein